MKNMLKEFKDLLDCRQKQLKSLEDFALPSRAKEFQIKAERETITKLEKVIADIEAGGG